MEPRPVLVEVKYVCVVEAMTVDKVLIPGRTLSKTFKRFVLNVGTLIELKNSMLESHSILPYLPTTGIESGCI
jgi:hypothetical protein